MPCSSGGGRTARVASTVANALLRAQEDTTRAQAEWIAQTSRAQSQLFGQFMQTQEKTTDMLLKNQELLAEKLAALTISAPVDGQSTPSKGNPVAPGVQGLADEGESQSSSRPVGPVSGARRPQPRQPVTYVLPPQVHLSQVPTAGSEAMVLGEEEEPPAVVTVPPVIVQQSNLGADFASYRGTPKENFSEWLCRFSNAMRVMKVTDPREKADRLSFYLAGAALQFYNSLPSAVKKQRSEQSLL